MKYYMIILLLVLVRCTTWPTVDSEATSKYGLIENCSISVTTLERNVSVFSNFTYENGTIGKNFTGYETELYNVSREVCVPYIDHPSPAKDVRPSENGYACTNTPDYIVCDSVIDGNGDGVCSPGGGETCCRLDRKDGLMTCKNSEEFWRDTRIHVSRLKG